MKIYLMGNCISCYVAINISGVTEHPNSQVPLKYILANLYFNLDLLFLSFRNIALNWDQLCLKEECAG